MVGPTDYIHDKRDLTPRPIKPSYGLQTFMLRLGAANWWRQWESYPCARDLTPQLYL